jgi:hypothetical protein
VVGVACTLLGSSSILPVLAARSQAFGPCQGNGCPTPGCANGCASFLSGDGTPPGEIGGTWYWLRSTEEEKKVVTGLFNRYCIRCHGVDGRGVWDIPGIPNFTNTTWQASRTDPQLVRIILEGRGAIMPSFRGMLSLEEAWAIARHLRTFVPGSETSRPDTSKPGSQAAPASDKGQREPENLVLPPPTRVAPATEPVPK